MNNVGVSSQAFAANTVAPVSPLGRQVVGLETADTKEQVFTPVEQSASADSPSNQTSQSDNAEAQQQRQRAEARVEQQKQEQNQEIIRDLSARDREVRAHEQAHAAVGGIYAGSPSYTFQRGPDGVNYAVGGEVPISLPQGGDPQRRIVAAEQVRRAALAPAEPSGADRQIAAAATRIALEARAEIALQRTEEARIEVTTDQGESETGSDSEVQAVNGETSSSVEADKRQQSQRDAVARSLLLGEQLATVGNIERGPNVGAVVDQRA